MDEKHSMEEECSMDKKHSMEEERSMNEQYSMDEKYSMNEADSGNIQRKDLSGKVIWNMWFLFWRWQHL